MDMSSEQVLNTLGVTDGKILFEILPGWEKSWKGYDGEVFFLQEEFQKKMDGYTEKLTELFAEGNALQTEILEQLKKVKYE